MAERCFVRGFTRALVDKGFRALTRARSAYPGLAPKSRAHRDACANTHKLDTASPPFRWDPVNSSCGRTAFTPGKKTVSLCCRWVPVRKVIPRRGFSVIELLVVIAIMGVLAALLFPVIVSSRASATRARCISNMKQLIFANRLYAQDYDGRFVPAAVDIFEGSGGHWRWHGWRPTTDDSTSFDPQKSPLLPYMGKDARLKECPLASLMDKDGNAFEASGGGYGYNATYIGGSYWKFGMTPKAAETTASLWMVKNPERTVMFTDTGMPQGYPRQRITEYSFCEPPYVVDAQGVTKYRTTPSIHFRHGGRAVVGWCDGHVSTETMSFTIPKNVYKGDNNRFKVGWFGPDSNELFDLE